MRITSADLGERVVVRRAVPGETGPSGGPAYADVIGVLEWWGEDALGIRREDGVLVEVALADAVAGKTVPPRPTPRGRTAASD